MVCYGTYRILLKYRGDEKKRVIDSKVTGTLMLMNSSCFKNFNEEKTVKEIYKKNILYKILIEKRR